MKLKTFCIEGFRGYKNKVCIELNDLTAIIGRNDAGKSTVLEAMDCFFNKTKLDDGDYNIELTDPKEIRLTAVFTNLPDEIIIDETNPIKLDEQYLLNADGNLEIEKVYKGSTPLHKETYMVSNHPVNDQLNDLLTLKITALRTRANNLSIDLSNIDQTKKSEIRNKIWEDSDLDLEIQKILIKDEDTKKIADKIELYMPTYSLFKSDRPSTDQDAEAQDPMNTAIKEAMKRQEARLKVIARRVEQEVKEVADKTVEKLKTMDLDLADELNPVFKTDWGKVFKLSLTSDEAIPINKRGSGVRRLILLNFFRVKAEQVSSSKKTLNTIYAIEEPETSQHPDNQKMLMRAFEELSENNQSQVLFTTHTPMLTSHINDSSIRYIKNKNIINEITEENKKEIAKNLGVLPDHKVKLFVGVEGVNDINYLKNISGLISSNNPLAINLEQAETDGVIVFIPFGGSSFKLWINRLSGLNVNEYHICDRDYEPPTTAHYQDIVDEINRQDGKKAVITTKKELENYIHHEAIQSFYLDKGVSTTVASFNDFDDVPYIISEKKHDVSGSPRSWTDLEKEKKDSKVSSTKKTLNNGIVQLMSYEQYCEVDSDKEIENWLIEMKGIIDAI